MCAGSNPQSRTPHSKRYARPVDLEYQPSRPCEIKAFWLLFYKYKNKDWANLSKDFNSLVAEDQASVRKAFERQEDLPAEGEQMRMTNPTACRKFYDMHQQHSDRVAAATASQSNSRTIEMARRSGVELR